jgi:outer membrane protein OmpA-like peptidoglycan-associated protein
MKKILIYLMMFVVYFNIFSQEQKKVYKMERAYVFQKASLLISESDLYCTFFIGKKIRKDVLIVGAQEIDLGKTQFLDHDKLVINKGSSDGIKEGSMWLILGKGKKIQNPFSHRSLGTYYLKKSLAEVTCIYEKQAIITLKKVCGNVNIGDLLIPFKEESTVFKSPVDYKQCRIPKSPFEGVVVYIDFYMDMNISTAGSFTFLSVDLGKALVSKGDFVLFYRILKRNLPPVIIGLGIVVSSQNTNSTVKVLNATRPIKVGDRVVLLPDVPVKTTPSEEEDIPIVDTIKKEIEESGDEKRMEIDVLFDLNSSEIKSEYDSEFDKIKTFIEDKSQFVIILRGYTCSIGGFENNLKLSKERVDRVKEILIKKLGVDESFIETYFYGEKDAPFDNTSEEQRRKNRLVKIQLLGK